MTDIRTPEGREKVRRLMETMPHSEGLHTALDGLDIAQEMREVFEGLLQDAWADADVHPRHGYGTCKRCDMFWDDSIAVHAKWDKWKGEQ